LLLSRVTLHFGFVEEDKQQAAEQIHRFHVRVNAGQFNQIYDDANAAFRESLSRQDWVKHMQDSREQYGAFKKVTFFKANVITDAQVQVRAVCNSAFEKADATEMFGFVREGHRIQLLSYGIFSGSVPPSAQGR